MQETMQEKIRKYGPTIMLGVLYLATSYGVYKVFGKVVAKEVAKQLPKML